MAIRSIGKTLKTENQSEIKINAARHSNPFGVSFNGRAVNADVFEKATPKLSERVVNRSKMIVSTIVGSINSLGNIGKRFDSIVEAGRKINQSVKNIGNSVADLGQKIAENVSSKIEIARNLDLNVNWQELSSNMKSRLSKIGAYRVSRIEGSRIEDVSKMFEDELTILALS